VRDIIESIDGAIYDWETSNDAMRWMPPEKRVAPSPGPLVAGWHAEGESLPVQVVGPFRLVSEQVGDVLNIRIEFNASIYAEAMERINSALQRMTEQFAGLTYSSGGARPYFDDPPLYDGPVPRPETSRERALRLTQSRSHGPDIPLNRRLRDMP
jgi:hypothetical protein